jgi:hypothetical protein
MFSSSLTSPLAVCGGITVVLACSRYLINKLNKLRIERQTTLLAEIILDYGLLQCTAYYDTGNTLYDKNNHPVVVICGKLAEKLPFDVIGDIAISSVTGIKILPLINLRLKVYYSDHKHKLYDVHAAISNEMRRMHDIILHRDMGE